jgi:septal ring factor EnvC (AmiA/AmiB activator)
MRKSVFFSRYFVISIFILIGFLFFYKVDFTFAETNEETRARLQAELSELERQIADQQKVISTTQAQSASLSRDITLLQSQINKKQLEIKKIDGTISSLSNQISNKNLELNALSNDLDKQKRALASALRDVNSFDGANNFINLHYYTLNRKQ